MSRGNRKTGVPDIFRPEVSVSFLNFSKKSPIEPKKPIKSVFGGKKAPEVDLFIRPGLGGTSKEYSFPIKRGSVKHVPTQRSKFKVVVRRVERPFKDDFEHQLAWICSSLGFFEPIDKDKNAAAVFKEIVLAAQNASALSSTALASRIGMSRGAVINHLNNLLHSGLIEKNGHFYSARSRSMKRTIEEIEEDVERVFSQLKKSAQKLDAQIGFDGEDLEKI